MNNYSLLFYTKKSKNKSEFSTIYLRITIKGRRSEISTKQTVLTSLWCSESGKLKGNSQQAKAINSLLDNYKLKVFSSYNELIFANKEVTAETLKANGIISKTLDGVKILGRGELNKKLTVKVAKMSASAKEKIEKAGGKAEVM